MLGGLRGEDSIAELCRREGLGSNIYDRWSKDFLEAGRKRLAGDHRHEGGGLTRQLGDDMDRITDTSG